MYVTPISAELWRTDWHVRQDLGGRVETKVPREGFVLVDSGSAEDTRLRLCWTSPERPKRFFVPYTYVEACRTQGVLLKQIFQVEGEPMRMHIHPSIANVNARNALGLRIMVCPHLLAFSHHFSWPLKHSGGDPNASLQSARVILADPSTEIFQKLVNTYQETPEKYVESHLWVQRCIEKGGVTFTPHVWKNPGGRRAGDEYAHYACISACAD